MNRTRFAPSPTGLLHVGNAYSALQCQHWAAANRAELLLRIEDIDHTRCRPEFTDAIIEDLQWLGIRWQGAPRIQSQHLNTYLDAIASLRAIGAIYPCFCTRNQITAEIARMASAPHHDDPPLAYPGTCRNLTTSEQQKRMQNGPFAWRLDIDKALAIIGRDLSWTDESGRGHDCRPDHDVVIGRKDIGVSYHLAVVLDDADQGITHIIRGDDLTDATAIHRLLQSLLGLPEPIYLHHMLLLDSSGRRLAKRNRATTLNSLRMAGVDAERLRSFLQRPVPPVWPANGADDGDDLQQILHMLGNSR